MARKKNRRGRYEIQEKKASERKYTSYEDVPLEDYRSTEPEPSNITGKFLKVFLILFLSVVAVLAFMSGVVITAALLRKRYKEQDGKECDG